MVNRRRRLRPVALLIMPAVLLVGLVLAIWYPRPDPTPQAPKVSQAIGLSPGGRILDLSDEELAEDLDAMVTLGLTTLRLDFDWSRIERRQGDFDWDRTDRVVDQAVERGIEVHGLLAYTPSWARPDDTGDKYPPEDLDDFGRFATVVVERYRSAGIRSWEIWNEPNSGRFWTGPNGPDPEAYAGLLVVAADAIRAEDPSATIVSAGLAPGNDRPGEELSPKTFLSRMLAALPADVIDAVAVHPYSFPALPSDRSKDWNTFARLPELRELVVADGQDLPLWITEFGAPTGSADAAVSEERQAEIVADGLACLSRLPWVDEVFLYNQRDRRDGDIDSTEDNFGLLDAEGRLKPSAEAVIAFQQTPAGALTDSPCEGW